MSPRGSSTPTTRELVERYGSPLYLYELDDADLAVTGLRRALPTPSTLYYSLKANPHPLLARTFREAGCRAEISSVGELEAAVAAGFTADQCFYTGPGKARQEIMEALARGLRRFSVESATDYHKVAHAAAAYGTTAQCLLRVNTQRSHGGSGLRMTGVASQFGVDMDLLIATMDQFAPRPGGWITGVHFFTLSNGRDLGTIAAEITASITQAARLRDEAGLDLEMVDLGGGFAAPYAKTGARPDYSALRPVIEASLDEHLPTWRSGTPEIAFESGRCLVGGCGRLVCRVEDVKRSHDRTFVVLDGGINHLGGMAGLGRFLPMSANVRLLAEDTNSDDTDRATVVGPLCTPADQLSRDQPMSTVRYGDLVEIPNVGAYGLTASLLGFLSRPVAGEVVLRSGTPLDASRLELRRTVMGSPDRADQSLSPTGSE